MDFFNDFLIVDILAAEYGWTIEYIQGLEVEEVQQLCRIIQKRKEEHYKMLSYISVLSVNGKTIDTLLDKVPRVNNKKNSQKILKQQEQTMLTLFASLGMPPKKLKEGFKKGKLEI